MGKHLIYHIFGKKIGCTNDVKRRMHQQGIKEGEYEILEEHTNAKTASVRERKLQEQYGYKIDNIPYWKTVRNAKKAYTPQSQAKRVAKIDWKAKVANTDYKAARAKGAANTDYKARTANFDYKAKVINMDYKARTTNFDYKAKVANTDYKALAIKKQKSILQFDLQGNFIKEWNSIKKASEELNTYTTSINNCCKGKLKTAHGFVWKYKNK